MFLFLIYCHLLDPGRKQCVTVFYGIRTPPSSQIGRVLRLGSLLGWARGWLTLGKQRDNRQPGLLNRKLGGNFLGVRPVLILSSVNHNLQEMCVKQMRINLKILKRKGKILQEENSYFSMVTAGRAWCCVSRLVIPLVRHRIIIGEWVGTAVLCSSLPHRFLADKALPGSGSCWRPP